MDTPQNNYIDTKEDQGTADNTDNKNQDILPTDEKLEAQGRSNPNKINKYVVIAVIVIIILLIIAYVLYHFNILGVRAFVRNTLGLNHKTTSTTPSNSTSLNQSTNPALVSAVKSYFPSLTQITPSAAAVIAQNLNNSQTLYYSIFGEGNIIKPFQNGTPLANYSGMLMLLMVEKNNETLGYYYNNSKDLISTNIYNVSFKGTPGFVDILNITPPSNESTAVPSYGAALNLSSYHCDSLGLNVTFKNIMNETISIKNVTVFDISNSSGNNSIFSVSGPAAPNSLLTVKFPNEVCNPSSYAVLVEGYTNYSISNLSKFESPIYFSKHVSKNTPQEILNALAVSGSKFYGVSIIAGGNSYLSQANSSLNELLQDLPITDFS